MEALRLDGYIVTSAALKNNLDCEELVSLHSRCEINTEENTNNPNSIKMICKMSVSAKKQKKKFSIEVTIEGYFTKESSCDDEGRETDLHKAAFNMLYPYIRMYITSLTVNGGLPPLILPAMPEEMFDSNGDKDVTQ